MKIAIIILMEVLSGTFLEFLENREYPLLYATLAYGKFHRSALLSDGRGDGYLKQTPFSLHQ